MCEITEGREACQRRKSLLGVIARKGFESRKIGQAQPHTIPPPRGLLPTLQNSPDPLRYKGSWKFEFHPAPGIGLDLPFLSVPVDSPYTPHSLGCSATYFFDGADGVARGLSDPVE